MHQLFVKSSSKTRGETIVLRPAAKGQIRETLHALIGTRSFQVDLHADINGRKAMTTWVLRPRDSLALLG